MPQKGSILVVDDDSDIRHMMRVVLENNGYEVRTANDGNEALDMLASWRPDLVIMDVIMKTDTEGFDVACMLRNNPRFASVPIIMMTCFLEIVRTEGPGKFQKILGEEWPAAWLFEKPVDTERLLAKVESILAKGRDQRADQRTHDDCDPQH